MSKLSLKSECSELIWKGVLAGKQGLITPRDLFRWAERGAVGYQGLAENGYMVLGERLRASSERKILQETLERIMKAKVRQ